ncbi:MAG: hypothetical protein PHQ65_08395 [Bacteroidales bacterium]|nr:hypothetical protein [Bacteroidales bacterium]MDD3665270.1 hypothetical protein [Bacteroidales bacterium]
MFPSISVTINPSIGAPEVTPDTEPGEPKRHSTLIWFGDKNWIQPGWLVSMAGLKMKAPLKNGVLII